MVEVNLCNERTWHINKTLKTNLDILLNDVKHNDMDLVIIIDGGEGLGKSFMSRGIGLYCATALNSTFDVNDITFDLETYIKNSLDAGSPEKNKGKHKINVLDEGRHAINRTRANSKKNVYFTNFLSECRALRQVHIILAPAFHDLDKYIILWRMALLIHCEKNYKQDKESDTGVKLYRGQFKVYINSGKAKKSLKLCYDMKDYSYPYKYEVFSVWSNKEVFPTFMLEKYDKMKYEATIRKYYSEEENKDKPPEDGQEWIKCSHFAKKFGLESTTIAANIKNGYLEGKKFNNTWFLPAKYLDEMRELGIQPKPPNKDFIKENLKKARKVRSDNLVKRKKELTP